MQDRILTWRDAVERIRVEATTRKGDWTKISNKAKSFSYWWLRAFMRGDFGSRVGAEKLAELAYLLGTPIGFVVYRAEETPRQTPAVGAPLRSRVGAGR